MPKEELEFSGHEHMEWCPVPGSKIKGIYEKILAGDPKTDDYTRLMKMDAGVDSSPNGEQIHTFWEEVYILEGSLIDLRLNQEFKAGTYACRPPGMVHGPWRSPNGCITFECRYTKK